MVIIISIRWWDKGKYNNSSQSPTFAVPSVHTRLASYLTTKKKKTLWFHIFWTGTSEYHSGGGEMTGWSHTETVVLLTQSIGDASLHTVWEDVWDAVLVLRLGQHYDPDVP